jgi:CRP/FNR family cyclic AMP-dependent transcriptional regulator
MAMETLEPILAEHPFFKGLSEDYLKLIVGCASNVRFDAGAFVARLGQEANNFYLIRQGKVALEIFAPGHGAVTIETVGEGDIFGWSWLVPPYKWRLDARATELTRAIGLDGQCLRRKCEDNHDLGYELLKRIMTIVTQRFEATRLQILDLYGTHA